MALASENTDDWSTKVAEIAAFGARRQRPVKKSGPETLRCVECRSPEAVELLDWRQEARGRHPEERSMPGCARKEIVRDGEVATYHCWSRCVQRAHLWGFDRETGQDFDHRRAWAEDLLAYQARVFAIDVGNFNLLSNHAHHILRTRPDIAESWSHEELAVRWKMA